MTARRDPDLEIAAWLQDEAPERAPERLLAASRDRIRSTHQRRARWPAWRSPLMNTPPIRLAAVVAAVAVVAVLGIVVFSRPGGVGGPIQTRLPSPSPSQAPGTTPAPSPSNLTSGPICTATACLTGALNPGTYSFDAGNVTPRRLTFTVPAGWTIDQDGFVSKHAGAPGEVLFGTWIVTHAYPDICQREAGTLVDAGTTTDELASVLVAQKGRVASAATDVTLGGYPAKRIELTVPADLDVTKCVGGVIRFWPDPGPDESGGLCCSAVGSTDVVYIVDVAGDRLTVVARHQPGSSAADLAELEAIVASIAIVPLAASPSPSGASQSP